jgi:hypothetical protein
MSDVDQPGEELDENLSADYPPDRPLGLYDEEATGVEEEGDEDEYEDEYDEGEGPTLEGDADVDAVDDEKDLVAPPVGREAGEDAGPLADDDEFTGDETRRDVATEHVPRPAEESAVRYDDTPPGATG